MTFDWMTFGLQLVNVLILLAILRRFLFRPVADIIAARQKTVQDTLDDANRARAEAKAATAAAQSEAAATATARAEVLEKAKAEADTRARAILDDAKSEAARIIAAGVTARENDDDRADRLRLDQARDLATAIASRVLGERPKGTAGYIARLEKALSALSPAERQKLVSGDLTVTSASKLTKTERAQIATLTGAQPSFETDPALIEGIELRSSTGVLHNSLAHDLSVLAKAMNDDRT